MHVFSLLSAAVVALALPARALVSAGAEMDRSEALYALNTMQSPGMEFGRFFDAAAVSSARIVARVAAPPPDRSAPPPPRPAPEPAPFALTIPRTPPPPFQRTFSRLMKRGDKDGYDPLIAAQAEREGLDPRLVKSVIAAESEFTAHAKSPAGALGLMQVRPATAGEMGVSAGSLFDPVANIRAGTRYLAYLFERAWSKYHLKGVPYARAPEWLVQRVIAAYNAGPRWVSRRPMYRQTRDYVRKVLMYYRSAVSELKRTA
jgi:soluble lytic murein transglycosylase-like protein